MTLQTFQNPSNLCHIVPYGLPHRATTVAQNGTQNPKSLITYNKNRLYHINAPFSAQKPLILLSETPLQLQLRQVCLSDRSKGPKPLLLLRFICNWWSDAYTIARRFGTAAQLVVITAALASPLSAEGWTPVSSGVGWSSADRFSPASATAASPSTAHEATRRVVPFVRAVQQSQGPQMDRLLTLISQAESPVHGYDSVHHGATIRPPKRPSQMTIAEIVAWVRATPGQPHAIGRNQIIPATFNRVVRALGLSGGTLYDRRTQDMMGRYLVEEAGYSDFINGRITRDRFMDQLAKVWAGLPLANGRSHYHGYAGNRATITRAEYSSAMAAIFPVRRASN